MAEPKPTILVIEDEPALQKFLRLTLGTQDYNVIVTSRKPGSLPSALWHSSYVIYM